MNGAHRALTVVKQKLRGSEGREPLSVNGQVSWLLHQATDRDNLSAMYYGYFAWV
jgi:phosphatidylinositol kinase/protein kinase (PI-3  family)